MKIAISISLSYVQNGANRISKVGRTLDTEKLSNEDIKKDYMLTIKESIQLINKKGIDLSVSPEEFEKFFEEED